MPRPQKKPEEKGKLPVMSAPPPMMGAPIMPGQTMMPAPPMGMAPGMPQPMPQRVVDAEAFTRVREASVQRLMGIMEAVRAFAIDYQRQTNLLLGEPTDGNEIFANFDHAAAQLGLNLGELGGATEEKKERKKRTHDPNAPKRPLTPYFLYMQHARSIIANDLGADAPKGAVQSEGQRRWANMGPNEKQGWNNAYQYNLRLYNARVHSYKAGNPLAKNMSDEEAMKYAEDFSIPMPEMKDASAHAGNDQDAIAQQLQQATAETPKKAAASRKRKSGVDADVSKVSAVATPAGPSSPDKKRRRSTKAPEEEPKKAAGGRGKKTKSS